MICPRCRASHKRRKYGGVCAACRYRFAFDPKIDGITDAAFASLVKKVSANETRYFTLAQLGEAWRRQPRFKVTSWGAVVVGGLLFVAGIAAAVASSSAVPLFLTLFGIGLGAAGTSRRRATDEPDPLAWAARWEAIGKPLPKLLRHPALEPEPQSYAEPDLFDYGAERLVIVQHDLLVDLLVRNGFHAEQRAVVISERGYPGYLVPHVVRLLNERPDLPVALLRDPTPEGEELAARLSGSTIFPLAGRRLLDAGACRGTDRIEAVPFVVISGALVAACARGEPPALGAPDSPTDSGGESPDDFPDDLAGGDFDWDFG